MNPGDQIKLVYDRSVRLPDVTWVGPNPREPGLFLGFDDGSFLFTDARNGYVSDPQAISPSGEAINGIAAAGPMDLAFSTRSEISFIQGHSRMIFPGGSHGVVATKSGFFVAPLGAEGLLVARPERARRDGMEVGLSKVKELYFYKCASLCDNLNKEILVFAHRKGGVGMARLGDQASRRSVQTWALEGMDIVDVCALAPGSLAAIAISRTGDLLWIEDTSAYTKPAAFKLTHARGVVYRVLAAGRYLFVLTSKALYGWVDFVDRVLASESGNPDALGFELPMEAVDMALVDDRFLLLVMADNRVLTGSLAELDEELRTRRPGMGFPGVSPGDFGTTGVSRVFPTWPVESTDYVGEMAPVHLLTG